MCRVSATWKKNFQSFALSRPVVIAWTMKEAAKKLKRASQRLAIQS